MIIVKENPKTGIYETDLLKYTVIPVSNNSCDVGLIMILTVGSMFVLRALLN